MRGLGPPPRCRGVGGLPDGGVSHPSSAPSGGTFSRKGRRKHKVRFRPRDEGGTVARALTWPHWQPICAASHNRDVRRLQRVWVFRMET